MGILIGAILGYKVGGYFGMILLGFVGHWIESLVNGTKTQGNKKAVQQAYFNALFLTMGRLAKVDGRVSQEEIARAENIIQHMQLSSEMRCHAIELFNQGKQGDTWHRALRQFGLLARRSLSLRQIFLEMLIDVAEADGQISKSENQFLAKVCQLIGYPIHLFEAMARMRGMGAQFDPFSGRQRSQYQQHNNQQRYHQNSSAPTNPYAVLGVNPSDSKVVIRKAYKKLMSQHHPDKLVAKGLPPEMMKVAEEKAKQVQLAWETIKDSKGW